MTITMICNIITFTFSMISLWVVFCTSRMTSAKSPEATDWWYRTAFWPVSLFWRKS